MAQAPTYEVKIQRLMGAQTQDEDCLTKLGAAGWRLVSVVVTSPDWVPMAYLVREVK